MKLIPLGLQISSVDVVGGYLQWDTLHDLEPVALQTDDLSWIVCEQADLLDAQIDENLGPYPVVPKVGRIAELVVCLNSIRTRVLQSIGTKLMARPMPLPSCRI